MCPSISLAIRSAIRARRSASVRDHSSERAGWKIAIALERGDHVVNNFIRQRLSIASIEGPNIFNRFISRRHGAPPSMSSAFVDAAVWSAPSMDRRSILSLSFWI